MKPRLTLTVAIVAMLLLAASIVNAVTGNDFAKSPTSVHDGLCKSSGSLTPSIRVEPFSTSIMSEVGSREIRLRPAD